VWKERERMFGFVGRVQVAIEDKERVIVTLVTMDNDGVNMSSLKRLE